MTPRPKRLLVAISQRPISPDIAETVMKRLRRATRTGVLVVGPDWRIETHTIDRRPEIRLVHVERGHQ